MRYGGLEITRNLCRTLVKKINENWLLLLRHKGFGRIILNLIEEA
jgi:hypothetical protein